MGASCGDCSRTRQHHCENDLRRPARTGGPESADKRQPSAFLLPATPRPRGNAGFLTIIPRQAPPAEKEPRPSQPCGVHRRAWRHHPGRRPQPFPQLRQCPGAAKGSPRAKSLRAQKHAENTRNGAQKRTRTSTTLRSPPPEDGASTNSAIWAHYRWPVFEARPWVGARH